MNTIGIVVVAAFAANAAGVRVRFTEEQIIAVLREHEGNTTLVDCWTGRSDSFAPLRIRPDLATARTMVLACAASTPDQALRQRLEERIAACRRRDRAWRWRRPDCVAEDAVRYEPVSPCYFRKTG